MWKIGNIKIKNQVVLAPMAGVSNPAYMKICEQMGVGYAETELISSEAIVRNNKKTFEMLNGINDLKIPYAIQLFGANPEVMGNAAKIINKLYPKSIISINMGCPVPKVALKSEAGSALLKNPNLVKNIVESVVKSVNVPVTVKIRSGWDEKSINCVEIAKIIEEAGASAITLHARTRKQGYSGLADWNLIKQVKENVNIPVIGNGDIKSPELAKKMLDETKCDAIMIGRAVLGNPWIIRNTVSYLKNGKYDNNISIKEIVDIIKEHFKLLMKYKSERAALLEIRSHTLWYLKGIKNISSIKQKICAAKTSDEIFDILGDIEKYESNKC